jgi:LPS O-antigen subunit length determinant protein (WzzB/FepE family)
MIEKEQQSTTQHERTQNFHSSTEDEINLIDMLEVLLRNKVLILAITSIGTLISLFYIKSITPIYKTTIAILEPQETFYFNFPEKTAALLSAPRAGDWETSRAFSQFLTLVMSFSHKKEVFEQGDFLKKFYGSSNTALIESTVLGLHNSINISKEKIDDNLPDFEKPSYIELVGSNPKFISEYLTALVKSAKEKTILDIRNLSQSIINAEMKSISAEIENLRMMEKEKIDNDIMFLSEAMEIADTLGIQNNNFDKLNNQDFQIGVQHSALKSIFEYEKQSNTDIRIENKSLPLWFLYGKKGLQQELKKYRNHGRVTIGVAAKKNTLKRYKSIDPSLLDIKVVTISQPSIPPTQPIKSKNTMYVLVGMISGLIIGIVITYIKNLINNIEQRQQSITSTQKP